MQQTSLAAYRSVQADGTIEKQKARILETLERIGSGNAYQIGCACGMKKEAVGRRLSELSVEGKVRLTGKKAPTDSGRMGDMCELVK